MNLRLPTVSTTRVRGAVAPVVGAWAALLTGTALPLGPVALLWVSAGRRLKVTPGITTALTDQTVERWKEAEPLSAARARYDAAVWFVRRRRSPHRASSMSYVPALKEPSVKVSIPPPRILLRRQQQASVSRQRPRTEHRGVVSAARALRVPISAVIPTGLHAAFHDPSARFQPVRSSDDFTTAGGLA